MPGPNANGFASQWNIGFKPMAHVAMFLRDSVQVFLIWTFWLLRKEKLPRVRL